MLTPNFYQDHSRLLFWADKHYANHERMKLAAFNSKRKRRKGGRR